MTKNVLLTVLGKLVRVSRKSKVKLVLMGGIATSIFARPRATYDIDGIISLRQEQVKDFLALLKKSGFKFERKQPVKFIQRMPLITFYYPRYKVYVDLFVACNEFQYEILKRAKKIRFHGWDLYVIAPEDLTLIKLQTGREKDLEDVREIILENKARLDFRYLQRWARLLGVGAFLKDELKSLGLKR